MHGVVIETKNELKALSGKFNQLCLVCAEARAWYIYDAVSTATPDDDDVLIPNDNTGRWLKLNNYTNVFNDAVEYVTTGSTLQLDFTNTNSLIVTLEHSTNITFQTILRPGYFTCLLKRANLSGFNVLSWDNRVIWLTSPYVLDSSDTVILRMYADDDVIYNMSILEY